MSKQTYWITTAAGTHGQVVGTEERDRWTPRGWKVVDEPAPTDFVWMRKEGLDAPARFAYAAAGTWQQMGWQFCPPPEPVDVTKDPHLFDQADEPAAAPPPVSKKPATGADKTAKE